MKAYSRRAFIRLSAAAGIGVLAGLSGCSGASGATASGGALSTRLSASFILMSDVHINNGNEDAIIRFRQALNDVSTLDTKPNAIAVIGDLSDQGYADEHEIFKQIVAESPFSLPNDFVIAMGNHDYWVPDDAGNVELNKQQKENFVHAYNLPGLYYDRVIAGQHVVVLGPDQFDPTVSWVHFDMTDEQLMWLDSLLATDAANGKYTYVLCHEPINETVQGCEANSWGANNSFLYPEKILNVVGKYPKCVFITGHTHVYPGVTAVDRSRPIFVNDGSCARSYKPSSRERSSWGLQMNIYSDHLQFRVRDFEKHIWEDDGTNVLLDR